MYQLRSSCGAKHVSLESTLQTISKEEVKDVKCVICREPPHNAVLLFCGSYMDGCRTYMCDTSARHSNCFKKFKKHNGSRLSPKALSCPHCRGDVLETVKVTTSGRRFLNAKRRSCSVEGCRFKGTYSQLNNHLKDERHTRFMSPPRMRTREQMRMDEMQRNLGNNGFRAVLRTLHELARENSWNLAD